MNRHQIREDDATPQTVEEWIERVNESHAPPAERAPELPSGWWILPGLLFGAALLALVIVSCT